MPSSLLSLFAMRPLRSCRLLGGRLLVAGVGLVGLGLTLLAWQWVGTQDRDAHQQRFERQVEHVTRSLQMRLAEADRLLRAGAALMVASDEVTYDDWNRFVDRLDLPHHIPSVVVLGMLQIVEPGGEPALREQMARDGVKNFRIFPPVAGAQARLQAPVVRLAPTNPAAATIIGLDHLANPVKKEALQHALDTGETVMSPAVHLVHKRMAARHPTAAMLYLPLYRRGITPRTPAERAAALQGVIYITLHLPELFRSELDTAPEGVHLSLYDLRPDGSLMPLYASGNAEPAAQDQPPVRRRIEYAGHAWELRASAMPPPGRWAALPPLLSSGKANAVLMAGLAGTAFICLLLGSVQQQQRRARAEAEGAGMLAQAILDCAPLAVIACDRDGRVLRANPGSEQLLGYAPAELAGRDLVRTLHLSEELDGRLDPLDGLADGTNTGEWTWRRQDGSGVPVMVAYAPLRAVDGSINGLLALAQDISERKRHEAFIRHLAHHDELTGLPNRTLLAQHAERALEQARGRGRCTGVLLIDLDRFKQINDSLGHNAGDAVLCAVANRLKHGVRSNDTVARLGGDEFVVLLDDLAHPAEAEAVAAKLIGLLACEPVRSGSRDLIVTPSIGVACSPADGDDLPTLLRNADVAMYQAKGRGRNAYALYTPQMHQASSERLLLEGELRQAVAEQALQLHYQPLVDLSDGRIVGVEALLRWPHAQRGFVPPDRFIPIAEETGLILPLGEWVLRRACADLRALTDRCGHPLTLAVNLSPLQLRAPGFVELIADCLATTGWAAEDLELEITESLVIDNPEASIETMQRLRRMGIGFAIDDFGTGYSSLSYLSRFPLSKLKIDRSFVRGLPHSASDMAIARSVVSLGHGLKLQVLAEGVETEAQAEFLRGLGCDLGQGWLFAKPLPLEALAARLDAPVAA